MPPITCMASAREFSVKGSLFFHYVPVSITFAQWLPSTKVSLKVTEGVIICGKNKNNKRSIS